MLKLGITPKKTYTVMPNKELKYSINYWRGMIDGNGSFCKSAK
ncbi:uncharacterized protein METZ01_LOCUS65819 [marine metagenome]|uniref:Homing endonuclease LAGLIDADG domain-containing protein n=1 Tax=marine metagenome TaxID=408172 RepID=A0A381T9Y1_9ZZZZ